MNRIITYTSAGLAIMAGAFLSCNKSELDEFKNARTSPVTINAGSIVGDPQVGNETVTLRWEVELSAVAERAFDVSVELNTDTVMALIADQTLENTVALTGDDLLLPVHLSIPYGVKSASMEVEITRTALERNFGKNTAFALSLVQPGKGNKIGERTSIIVLNTNDLLEPGDLHYVYFASNEEGQMPIGNRQNYIITSAGVEVQLRIELSGAPTRSFFVRAALNNDTIAGLVDEGKLPANTMILPSESYIMDTVTTLSGNQSYGFLKVIIPWPVLQDHADSVLALAVDLYDPSRHVLHPEDYRVIALIDPSKMLETDVTSGGTLSVSRDNNGGAGGGEGSLKVVDGNIDTKFLQSQFIGDLWIQLTFPEPTFVGAYTMASANDAPARDPKDWRLSGSNDGVNWVRLDSRSNESFPERFLTKRYDFQNSTPYVHYRLEITANHGNNLFQMAEYRLIRTP